MVIGSAGAYSRTDQNLFFKLFLNPEVETEDPDFHKIKNIFNVNELGEAARNYLDNYFRIGQNPEDFFENYELISFKTEEGVEQEQVMMDMLFIQGIKFTNTTIIRRVITKDDYSVFKVGNEGVLRDIVKNSQYFMLSYHLTNTVPMGNAHSKECFHWTISQKFDFSARNHISLTLDMDKEYCAHSRQALGNFFSQYIWLHICCIILASISLFLNIKYIMSVVYNFGKMKDTFKKDRGAKKAKRYRARLKDLAKKNKKTNFTSPSINNSMEGRQDKTKYQPDMDMDDEHLPNWNDLTNKDKLKLFSTWNFVVILANILLITGSIFLILNTKTLSERGELFIGFGSMLTWFSLMRFYQNTKGYNTVANTLENSFEIVFKALTGIMPIFIGFGLLGTSIFWRSYRFCDFNTSMFTLFAAMNGDTIWDIWHDLDSINFLLAQLYLYSFILLSI